MVDFDQLNWTERHALAEYGTWYARSLCGLPYRWGGDDPMEGFDCSGLVIEVLKSVGLVPDGFDARARQLWDRFKEQETKTPRMGCLLFWMDQNKIAYHVAMYVGHGCFVEAGGGSSKTTDEATASAQNAFVRMRHISNRPPTKIADVFGLRSEV